MATPLCFMNRGSVVHSDTIAILALGPFAAVETCQSFKPHLRGLQRGLECAQLSLSFF